MRSVLLGGILLGVLVLAGCVAKPDLGGPLPVRNQHPAQLTVLHLEPADAKVLSAGQTAWRTDYAYTSLFLFGNDAQGSGWFMDGEMLRAALDAKVGLGNGVQLGVQLAAAHSSGGFLDHFVVDYHDVFGLPDQNRSNTQDDRFLIEATQGANTVWQVQESSAELLDLPIHLTWQLREPGEEKLGVAVRGGIELPTGDQDDGYGNGQVDASLGALLDYRQRGIGWSGHVSHTLAGTPRQARHSGFDFQDVTSIGIGVELPLQRELHALVQVEWETSTLRDLGPNVAAREQVLLWFGARYQAAPHWSLELGFGEDLRGLASPDFTAWVGVTWKPGA